MHGRECPRENLRALRIVRDVEDESADPLKSPRDANAVQRGLGVLQRGRVWRTRGVEQRQRKCDVLRLVTSGERRVQTATIAKGIERERGA